MYMLIFGKLLCSFTKCTMYNEDLKALWGHQNIYVLGITFQPLWFWFFKWLHIAKGDIHISLGDLQKITKCFQIWIYH